MGKLSQLIEFLYKFYSAGYLHQIRSIDIKVVEKSNDLSVVLLVEILSLPDSPRTGELPKVSAPAKKPEATLEVYRTDIADRNPFSPPPKPVVAGPVEPPKPPPEPPKAEFDVSKHVVVTGIVIVDGMPEALVKDRTTDQVYRLHPGDAIAFGTFKGTVGRIGEREVEFLIGSGDPVRVGLNEPLKKSDNSVSADAKAGPAVALAEKGKSADPRGRSPGDADSSKDPRGKDVRMSAGGSRKKGFRNKKGEDQKAEK
jgi:hypothetical protein